MAGASISSRLVTRWPAARVVLVGAGLAACASTVMALLAHAGVASVFAVVPPMFVVAMGMGLLMPRAQAEALIPFPQMAGLASAVLGFSQMLVASVYSIVFGLVAGISLVTMTTGIAVAGASALVTLVVLRPRAEMGGEAAAAPVAVETVAD
jgi:DHA1 family bicyclomycin/chloramphenicol resistance-like MFS transporter